MKPIKFDLPLNGTRIANLEQLEENLTPEILEHFHSGKLAKWLQVRNLNEQANTVESLTVANIQDEIQLFKKLCEVFVSEVDENDAREAIEEYKAMLFSSQNTIEEEIIVEEIEIESKTEAVHNFVSTLSELAEKKENEPSCTDLIKRLEESDKNNAVKLHHSPIYQNKCRTNYCKIKKTLY